MPAANDSIAAVRYAQLASYVRNVLLPETRSLEPHVRVRKMLLTALNDRRFGVAEELRRKVLYVVLNHPPLITKGEHRHFVAAILLDHVVTAAPDTVAFLRQKARERFVIPDVPSCDTSIVAGRTSKELSQAAKWLWIDLWDKYWGVTEEGMMQGRYTWNQFLLNPESRPLPIGLCWHRPGKNGSKAPYFPLSAALASELGLPKPGAPNWRRELMRLDNATIESKLAGDVDLTELHLLQKAFDEIYRGANLGDHAAGWAASYLTKYYGIWGGTAFLSLPVVIGTAGLTRCAVLSVCTRGPLTPNSICEWKLIASALLRPLVEEEWEDQVRQRDHADTAFDFAHFIKNRTMPLTNALDDLSREINSSASSAVLRSPMSVAQERWQTLQFSSTLLDAHAHAIASGKKEFAFQRRGRNWTCRGSYDARGALVRICGLSQPQGWSKIVPSLEHLREGLSIAEWIPMPDGSKCRPTDPFYDAILEELVINAATHSHMVTTKLVASFERLETETSTDTLAIVLRNECGSAEGLDQLFLEPGKWRRWPIRGRGGLSHIARFLSATNMGKGIFVKSDSTNEGGIDRIHFSAAIAFNALQQSP